MILKWWFERFFFVWYWKTLVMSPWSWLWDHKASVLEVDPLVNLPPPWLCHKQHWRQYQFIGCPWLLLVLPKKVGHCQWLFHSFYSHVLPLWINRNWQPDHVQEVSVSQPSPEIFLVHQIDKPILCGIMWVSFQITINTVWRGSSWTRFTYDIIVFGI